tara:strand:+ start:13451 stop:15034 length:1584 start_codon:yes stop_codon:yes gene_type:complete
MKKITLLALLMWASLFYGQTYLSEGFETSVPPTGWTDEAGPGDISGYPWQQQAEYTNSGKTFTPLVGTSSAFYNELFNLTHGENAGSPVAKDKWLISSAMDLSSATNPEIRFYETTRSGDFLTNQFHVYYSITHDGVTFDDTQWVDLGNTSNTWVTGPDDFVWKQRIIDLSAANNNSSVYIAFRYRGTNDVEWYIDEVLVRETPTCIEPSYGTISNVLSTSADFSWTSGPGGTETLWDVNLLDITGGDSNPDVDGTITNTPGDPSANQFPFTSLTPGNIYAAYVRADCGGGDKSIWNGPFTFNTQGVNDDCSGAISVVHESGVAIPGGAVSTSGSIDGAIGTTTSTCAGGTPNNDVWFSFQATSTVATVLIEASATFDAVLEVFDACGGTQIGCIDGGIENEGEELNVFGLTSGSTYYIRVYDWYTTIPANGDFSLKVYRNVPLGIEDNVNVNEFKLYPNPVQDKLNLRAQDNIENVSIYNMLGQEVLRQAPNKNSSEINMSALQTGSYFVKVTINGVTKTKQIIKR